MILDYSLSMKSMKNYSFQNVRNHNCGMLDKAISALSSCTNTRNIRQIILTDGS